MSKTPCLPVCVFFPLTVSDGSSGVAPAELRCPQSQLVGPPFQLRTVLPMMCKDFIEHLPAGDVRWSGAANDSRILAKLLPRRLWDRAKLPAELASNTVAGQSKAIAD